MPRFMDYMVSTPVHGSLDVLWPETQRAEIFYIPSKEAVAAMRGASIPNRMKLLDIDRSKRRLTIQPIDTRWKVETFLKPKYAQIRKLTLAGREFIDFPINDASLPSNEDEVMMLLEDLPESFIKDFEYGLGFAPEYRRLIPIVEALSDASELQISDNYDTGEIEGQDVFCISSDDFDAIRKTINRISDNVRTATRMVKYASVHNMLAQRLGQPEIEITYGRSPLRKKFTQIAIDGEPALSKAEQSELINVVSKHAKSMVEDQPDRLVRLQRDFELVTLDRLIKRFEDMIGKILNESDWQEFLNENRFLLGLTFGCPVIVVGDEASVGGHKMTGSGGKSTDFLVKHAMTNNVAIIEIKKPSSPLLYKTEYRAGVLPASKELSGAINQVIDQKHKLVSEFAQIKQNSRIFDIESYSVRCCLIIGKTPEDENERKSFEMIRGNSRDVDVMTFDEMLTKIQTVKEFLQGDEATGRGVANDEIRVPIELPW